MLTVCINVVNKSMTMTATIIMIINTEEMIKEQCQNSNNMVKMKMKVCWVFLYIK